MQRRPLGSTGLTVSSFGLGTMTFGNQTDRDDAFAQMDLALDHGIDLFDAAEMYPVPPDPETVHRTESILGAYLRERGVRGRVVVATKVTGRAPMPWIRGGPRLSAAHIRQAAEASLARLGVECIDLYQLHWPDRATNFFGKLGYEHPAEDDAVPLEESLEALAGLVRAGLVRHVGLSNETPWGLHRALRAAETLGTPRPVSIQNPYSLLNRSFEVGLAEMAIRESVGLLAYSPLGFGVLTGKYRGGARPEGSRLARFGARYDRYTKPQAIAATDRYCALAEQAGLDPAALALAYVASRPFTTSVLVGATTRAQLEANLRATQVVLTPELLAAIDAIHVEHPNPAP